MMLKKYLGYIIAIVIVTIGTYCGYLFIANKITVAKNEMLTKNEQRFEKQIAKLDENIKYLKDVRATDLQTIKESGEKIAKLENDVKNAKKPVVINQPKDDQEVIVKITTLYNDPTTKVNDSEFLIKKNTTYGMIYDAEQWKVNGPILKENLNLVTNLVTEQKFGIEVRDQALENDTKLLAAKDEKDKVKDDLLKNRNDAVININKQLNLSQKSGKMKYIGGVISGLPWIFIPWILMLLFTCIIL